MHGDCEVSLFVPTDKIPIACEKRIVKLNHSIFIQLATPNSWLYTAPYPERLDILCRPNQQRVLITLNSTGILQLHQNCSAYTNSLILNLHRQFSSKITIPYLPTLNLTEDLNFSFILNYSRLPLIPNSLAISSNDNKILHDLSIKLDSLEIQENSFNPLYQRINHIHILYCLFILLFTSIVIIICYKSFNKYRFKKCNWF